MKTSALAVIVAVVAVLAVAGAAVAASPDVAHALGLRTNPENGDGHMHGWQHQWSYQYDDRNCTCPMYERDNAWDWERNYSYDHDHEGCWRTG